MIYIVTGTLGAGKSLLATERALEYAAEGRRLALNFPIDLAPICSRPAGAWSQCRPVILPTRPTEADLLSLGIGGPTEDRAGLLVWDEAAISLNSRSWNDKGREGIIRWMLQARKRRWDVALLIQHERMLDKQLRDALGEACVRIRRTDRIKLPILGLKMPRVHIGVVRYGLGPDDIVIDRWITRGTQAMKVYQTTQIFDDIDEAGPYSLLPVAAYKWHSSRPGRNYREWMQWVPHLWKLPIWYMLRLVAPQCLPAKPTVRTDSRACQSIMMPEAS